MSPTALHALRRLIYWLGLACAASLCAALALLLVAREAVRPAPDAWATTLPMGPIKVDIGVPSLIWLATTPWVASHLEGHTVSSPMGPVRLGWSEQDRSLVLQCRPCSVRSTSWGGEAVQLDSVRLSVHREGMALRGSVASGALRASWRGQLFHDRLVLDLDLPASPIRDGYALFAASIAELATARIDGSFALHARLELPSRMLTVQPHVEGMAVQGLGTEQWVNARSVCSRNLTPAQAAAMPGVGSPLARAVLAAEDQRFFEHPGYDLVEMTQALRGNQRAEPALRGASTLSQQVAKLLVTGGERSPTRKLRELLYAVEMEQTLGKARILRLYLDNAPWGATICGAQAAAHTYFGKRADRLTTTEAIWLAAMLHNPALEARRWAASGQINQARVQWVTAGMRATARPRHTAVRVP